MKKILPFIVFNFFCCLLFAQSGSLDLSFAYHTGANGSINSIAIQPDGKILIAGNFTIYDGIERNRIARLHEDGSIDSTFNPGYGADNFIHAICLLPDGKILVGGSFVSYDTIGINGIARLNNDGSVDNTFDPGEGVFQSNFLPATIFAIALQPDGKILLGGNFVRYDGVEQPGIVRIEANGSIDYSFDLFAGIASGVIHSIAIQPDGKIITAGSYSISDQKDINRFNPNGTIDNSFVPATINNGGIKTVVLQPDGKILIGGTFTDYGGIPYRRIARLNANGSLDNSLHLGISDLYAEISEIVLQPDGKIIIAGTFGDDGINITRIDVDGYRDTLFFPGTGTEGSILASAHALINAVALQSDGKILIGGNFTTYNDTSRICIARLKNILGPNLNLSIQKNTDDRLLLYPNPSNGIFHVNLPSHWDPQNVHLEIITMLGHSIPSKFTQGQPVTFEIKGSPGMYVVKFTHNRQTFSQYLFIE